MKTDKLNRLPLPPGLPWETERRLFWLALVLAELYSLRFALQFWDARQSCFFWRGGQRYLDPKAVMPPFFTLMDGCLVGFGAAAVCVAALLLWHWHYYYEGSRSIDLMRRLPQKGLLARQIVTMPLVLAGVILLAGLVTTGLYALIYCVFTPPVCMPLRPWAVGIGG